MTLGLEDPKDRLVDTAEAATLIKLKPRTLEGFRTDGIGPRYYKLGTGKRAKVVYRVRDLDAWVEAHRHEPGKGKESAQG